MLICNIDKLNYGFRFLLCGIGIYSKDAWVVYLKDKIEIAIANAFQKILDESESNSNKIWVDKRSEFYNRSIKSFQRKNDIEMYSTHDERKALITARLIRTLKNKIYKYMTSISRNVYVDKLDDINNKYNNTYHRTIQMKPVDVKSSIYIESSKEINAEHPKFKIGDIVRISKYQNIFAKSYVPNYSEKVFAIWKIKKTVL